MVAVVSLQHPAREESVAYYNASCGVFSLVILYVYIIDQCFGFYKPWVFFDINQLSSLKVSILYQIQRVLALCDFWDWRKVA